VIVPVTISSQPAGLTFQSEGSTYTTPYTFQWLSGSSHSVAFSETLQTAPGQRLGFAKWLDGGTTPIRTVTVGESPLTLTAQYVARHKLTTSVAPGVGGLILSAPSSSDGYYNEGTPVQLMALANSAYQFTGFAGDLSGTIAQQQLVMSSPRNVIANFAPVQNSALVARIGNDVSRASQPGPDVTVNLHLTNTGLGSAKDIRLTAINARIITPAPALAAVQKALPVAIGDVNGGASTGAVALPISVPVTARRLVLLIEGTVRNAAGRLFTFSASLTVLR
jgi:hypothetical protein